MAVCASDYTHTMSGEFDNQVIYSREKRANGKPRIRIAASVSAKKEVQCLLASLEKASGGCTLEVQTIERIHKEEWQKSFEMKKEKLRQRSEQSTHWKYHELSSLKKDMRDKILTRNNLSNDEKVLEHRVYVGVDKDQIVEGIAETGFATTKCTNNWFGFGHYVTSHPWYAARYGMDGCYGGKDGILDPHADVAVGKLGRLLVCRAVMSNVYPITRSCKEDHAIEDFDMAAQQGKLWSEWYNESSDKPKALKQGYDAHFVRVKKADAGDYSNFLACPDGDVLKTSDEIADELVLREEEQLLPEYYVHFCVRKLADGLVYESGSSSGSDKESLKIFSSPAGSSTSYPCSRPSTQKAIDTPRGSVDVLLVDTEPNPDINDMWEHCERLERKGFDACYKTITSLTKLNSAILDRNPSIVYIRGSGNEGLKWHRRLGKLELIEELAMHLGNGPNIEGEWKHFRGCVLNFGTTKQHIADKLCEKLPGKLNLLAWAVHPGPEDMEALLDLFVDYLGEKSTYEKNEQGAFAQACQETMKHYESEHLVIAPRPWPPSTVRPRPPPAPTVLPNLQDGTAKASAISHSCHQKAAASASSPQAITGIRRIECSYKNEKGGKVAQVARHFTALPGKLPSPPRSCASSSSSSFSASSLPPPPLPIFLSPPEASIEAKFVTDPPVAVEIIQKSVSKESALEVEDRRELNQYVKQLVGEECGVRGIGSFYVRMSVAAFESLCSRVDVKDEPVYLKLPIAWGVGETRITKILPGRMCWLEALMPAQDVQILCNNLKDHLEIMKFEEQELQGLAVAEELGEAEELRVRTMAVKAFQATVNEEPCGKQDFEARVATLTDEILVEVSGTESVRDLKEKVANKMGWDSYLETQLVLDGVHLHNDIPSLFECGLTDDNRSFQAIRVESYKKAIDTLENTDPRRVGEVFQGFPANARLHGKVIQTAFIQCHPGGVAALFEKLSRESQSNEDIVKTAWQRCVDGEGRNLYEVMPEEWKNNADIIDKACARCLPNSIPKLYAALPDEVKHRADVVLKVLGSCDRDDLSELIVQIPADVQKSAAVLESICNNIWGCDDIIIAKLLEGKMTADDARVVLEQCQPGFVLGWFHVLPVALKTNANIIDKAFHKWYDPRIPELYSVLPDEVKMQEPTIQTAFNQCHTEAIPKLFEKLSRELQSNESLMNLAFEKCANYRIPQLFSALPAHLREKETVVLLALDNCHVGHVHHLFDAIPKELQINEDVIRNAFARCAHPGLQDRLRNVVKQSQGNTTIGI